MRPMLVLVLAALALPAAALATKPPHPSHPGTTTTTTTTTTSASSKAAKPKVTYVLRGTLLAYTPGASVQIAVKSAVSGGNHAAKALKGHTYTLTVTASTKVTLHNGTFTANDKGVVKFRAQKGLTDAGGQTATQIIDQGPASS
jgi:hypothetical protein